MLHYVSRGLAKKSMLSTILLSKDRTNYLLLFNRINSLLKSHYFPCNLICVNFDRNAYTKITRF